MQIVVVVVVFLVIYYALDKAYLYNWDRNLEIGIRFANPSVYEGEKTQMLETLSNAKWLPLPWLSVKFRVSRNVEFMDETLEHRTGAVSDAYYRNDLFSIIMYQRIVRTIPCVCKKRGFYTVSKIDIISSNAFVSTKYVGHLPCNASVTVYPKLIEVEDISAVYQRLSGSIVAKRFLYPDPFEFRGIREYEPFDPLKSVNFKASAKTGVMMTNTYDHTVSQEIVIVLNVQKFLTWSDEIVFEQSIRFAASIAANFIEEGVPVSFRSNGRDVVTGEEIEVRSGSGSSHLDTILDSMARLSYDGYIKPITECIDNIVYDRYLEPLYVIISPYCGQDLRDSFEQMNDNAFSAEWFIPVLPSDAGTFKIDEITTHNITKWEINLSEA